LKVYEDPGPSILDDHNDEDGNERGRALVMSRAGWRTEMAKWISSEARAAELAEDSDTNDSTNDLELSGAQPSGNRSLLQFFLAAESNLPRDCCKRILMLSRNSCKLYIAEVEEDSDEEFHI
jgi:hypothetical protein